MEVYEEYKHIITQKGNTVTIFKNREAVWQKKSVECISSNISNINININFTMGFCKLYLDYSARPFTQLLVHDLFFGMIIILIYTIYFYSNT